MNDADLREQARQLAVRRRQELGLTPDGLPRNGPDSLVRALKQAVEPIEERFRQITAPAPAATSEVFLPRVVPAEGACPDCGGTGHVYRGVGPRGGLLWEECHCERQRQLSRAMQAARMPVDAESWTFNHLVGPDGQPGPDRHNRTVVDLMQAWLADPDANLRAGTGFYLFGQGQGYGVGKSFLAGAFANACLALRRQDLSVVWLSSAKVAPLFFESFDKGEGAELRLTQQLETCGILVLDDLDKVQKSPAVVAKLWACIDARFADRRPLVITANVAPDGLGRAFGAEHGDSMASRIAGRCHLCPLGGPDRRQLQRPGRKGTGP